MKASLIYSLSGPTSGWDSVTILLWAGLQGGIHPARCFSTVLKPLQSEFRPAFFERNRTVSILKYCQCFVDEEGVEED